MGSADVTQDLVEVQAGIRCFAAGPGADPDPIAMPSGYKCHVCPQVYQRCCR
jgi:hypothetical protein